MTNQIASPVAQNERIIILDSLRGIAVLGILLMNIPYFALPDPAQFTDLEVLNERGTVNEKVWWVISLVFNGTMRALFCIMFGAGIILFTERAESKVAGPQSADYFFRRQLWLMLFGMINLYVLLWIGDYLFPYAAFGMILYTFRRLSAKSLIVASVICLLLMSARENVNLFRSKAIIEKGEQALRIDTTVTKLSIEEKEQIAAMKSFKERSSIGSRKKEMETSIRKVQGNYSTLYKYQTERGFTFFTSIIFYISFSHVLFMFLGMAFYKNGILTGNAPVSVYWIFFLGGTLLGLLLTYPKLAIMLQYNFDRFEYTKHMRFDFSEFGRVLRSIGLFGLLMLMFKSGLFKWLFRLMKPVGQMAFTNYLTQSLLMGLFFYGVGFGMFGKLERYEIYYVVGATWLLQIIWSHLWLRFFRFGPLEWCWRSLTYWKRQPLVK
jgi:uncharacterized protein